MMISAVLAEQPLPGMAPFQGLARGADHAALEET